MLTHGRLFSRCTLRERDRGPRSFPVMSTKMPRSWECSIAVLAAVFGTLAGCASQTAQAGLSNAPDENRDWDDNDRSQDAIANGAGSCPPSMKREDDPLPHRRPRCVEARPSSTITPTSSPAPTSGQ